MIAASQLANAGPGSATPPPNAFPGTNTQGASSATPFASVLNSQRSGLAPAKSFSAKDGRPANETRETLAGDHSRAHQSTAVDTNRGSDPVQAPSNVNAVPPAPPPPSGSQAEGAKVDAGGSKADIAELTEQNASQVIAGIVSDGAIAFAAGTAVSVAVSSNSVSSGADSENATAATASTAAEIVAPSIDPQADSSDFEASSNSDGQAAITQGLDGFEAKEETSKSAGEVAKKGGQEVGLVDLKTTLPDGASQLDSTPSTAQLQLDASLHETGNEAAGKNSSANAAGIAQQIESHLHLPPQDSQTQIPPAVGANSAPDAKQAPQKSSDANTTSEAQDSNDVTSTPIAGLAGNHSDTPSNSGGNAQKDSNSDSATVAKAAGLPPSAGDPSPHLSIDAAAQSIGAGTGSATQDGGAAEVPVTPHPLPFADAQRASLTDVMKANELYQRVGGAEMHISMDTDLLGSIDVRAVMHQSTLTATIGVQRADVQTLLSNELPALQHSLTEQMFHVEQISVLNNSAGGHTDMSGHPQQQEGAPPARIPKGVFEEIASSGEPTPLANADAPVWGVGAGRLSIRV